MWKIFIRPAMIFVPFGLGVLLQSAFKFSWSAGGADLSVWFIRISLMLMFFQICLQINLAGLRPRREHLKILLANILMGVAPYFILKSLGFETLALAAFFTGIAPTANAAPVVMGFLGGKVEFVLAGFAINNIFIDLILIALLPFISGGGGFGFALEAAGQIASLVGIPIILAAAARKACKNARSIALRLRMFNFTLWCCTLFVIASKATMFFENTPGIPLKISIEIALVSLALCAANFFAGAKISSKRYARESSQTLGQKNTTLAIFLALVFGGQNAALVSLGPTFYVLWHNIYTALQIYFYDRRAVSRRLGAAKIKPAQS